LAEHISPLPIAQRLRKWGQIVQQVIDLRLALVIALLAFVLVISLDSAGNTAEAADLANSTYRASPPVTTVAPQPSLAVGSAPALEVPHRLRHGLMTSAILTSNRLTEAHLFTDLSTDLSTEATLGGR
jgi:hypothetical protein